LDLIVKCQYQISTDWEAVADPYGCNLVSLNITTKVFVKNATGTHFPGKKNNDVKALTIYDRNCYIIPSSLGIIFPNIEALTVRNASLKLISSNDLQQFSNLREISLLGNDLDALESNLFRYNPLIEVVVVKSNKIRYIGGRFFDFLPNLRKADFSDNDCIVEEATELSDIKEKIKQKCDDPETDFRIATTIRPDGIFYWDWINRTINVGGGVASIPTDLSISNGLLKTLVG